MALSAGGQRTERYFLGLDAGQTFTKAVLFTEEGRQVARGAASVATSSPRASWQERDPHELWRAAAAAIRECLVQAGVVGAQVAGVGLCGHNDGAYLVDDDGEPTRAAILATDARAVAEAAELGEGARGEEALAETGQVPAPYSPSSLLSWLGRNEPETLERSRWYLFCKDWLRLKLTGEVATDPSEASASFTNLHDQRWSDEALRIYDLQHHRRLLPPLVPSSAVAGHVTRAAAEETGLAEGTPVVTGAHDVDAAALGIGAIEVGSLSLVMGTFSINQLVWDRPVSDPRWQARTFLEPGRWLHMSTSPSSASNFEWAMRNWGGGADYPEVIESARLLDPQAYRDAPHFLPYLYGAPLGHGADGARLSGLRGSHDRHDVFRAVLEGVVHQHRWHVDALRSAFSFSGAARLCGGGAKSEPWTQLLSDVLGVPVEVTDSTEAGARGAALLAAIGVGAYSGLREAVATAVTVVRRHEPQHHWGSVLEERYQEFLGLLG
ncbi:FGGY-family carbohydrate kinase [Arthrobacter sp. NPDC090010]|uniref:FGGY-family carbohydrate kinase n=1 Tax=Arthrobacter sp. NPDC090010 TaxID=3363942 RepID=UPI00381DED9C